jgi:curli biogenesis system outer membrane secretion channel CsgG
MQVASEPKKDPFFARQSDFLQAIAALWSKKIAKYGGKWDFFGQTAILLTSYKNIKQLAMTNQFILCVFFLLFITTPAFSQNKKAAEQVPATCKGLPRDQRPRITVSSFDITRTSARGVVGNELGAMLINALNQTECFNVLESLQKLGGAMEEMKFNQSGATDGSGPDVGKMKGAQLIINGEVTEFKEEKMHIAGVGSNKAHIGFILKIVDPQTREVLWSESINKKITKPEVRVFNTDVAKFGSTAMEDAVEKAILNAVSLIVGQKDLIESYKPKALDTAPKYDRNTCALNQGGNGPSVMVIIPEVHITRRVPDPAGETEIIKTLINAGFKVLDPSVYNAIRDSDELSNAVKNQDAAAASRIGARFGADIIIFGEAFSESTGMQNGMQSCRARVEARAVSTYNAQILGADGKHAGGTDNSELVAGKAALRNAGTQMGAYFVNTLCEAQGIRKGGGGNGERSSEIVLSNASFSTAGKVETYLKTFKGVKSVTKSFSNGVARYTLLHTGPLDDLAAALDTGKAGVPVVITGADGAKVEGRFK